MAELCLVLSEAGMGCHARRRLFEREKHDRHDGFPSLGTLRAIVRVLGTHAISKSSGWLHAHPAALSTLHTLLDEPSTADYGLPRLTALMPGAPADLASLIASALAFDPARRPTAASAMTAPCFRDVASRCLPGGVWWCVPPLNSPLSDELPLTPREAAEEDKAELRRMVLAEVGRCRLGAIHPVGSPQPTGVTPPSLTACSPPHDGSTNAVGSAFKATESDERRLPHQRLPAPLPPAAAFGTPTSKAAAPVVQHDTRVLRH